MSTSPTTIAPTSAQTQPMLVDDEDPVDAVSVEAAISSAAELSVAAPGAASAP